MTETTAVELLKQTAKCDWCHRQVVSYAGEPSMVMVTHRPDHIRHGTRDRVCLDCYAELIKFIWGRAA